VGLPELLFFGAKTIANEYLLVELRIPGSMDPKGSDVLVKLGNAALAEDIKEAVRALFGQ
jgi:hypothetical protein